MNQHIGRLHAHGDEATVRECLASDPVFSRLQGLDAGEETFDVQPSPYAECPALGVVFFAADGDLPEDALRTASRNWQTLVFTAVSYDPGSMTAQGIAFHHGHVVGISGMSPSKYAARYDGDGDALCEADEARLLCELEVPLDLALELTKGVPAPAP